MSSGKNIHMTLEVEMAIVKMPVRKGGVQKQWRAVL